MNDAIECDILVVGSGAAGLAAAVTASALNLKVIVCEQADAIGGATALSGGEVWIPMNRQAGKDSGDSPESALKYLENVIGEYLDRARVKTYIRRASEALAFLEDNSHVQYDLMPEVVDYLSHQPGATTGLRSLGATPFDGRYLGDAFNSIRAPLATSMIFGGLSLAREDMPHISKVFRSGKSLAYMLGLLGRHAMDRLRGFHRGTRMVMGNALVGRLMLTLIERNVRVWLDTPVTALNTKHQAVTGAAVERAGNHQTIKAKHGVILASGSFSGSAPKQSAYFQHVVRNGQHVSLLPDTSNGSGLDLALAAGGVIDDAVAQPAAWAPVSLVPQSDGSSAPIPHFGDRAKPGVIAVNRGGMRFANEARSYHEFVPAMMRTNAGETSLECYLITSLRHLRRYGLGRVPPFPGRIGPFIRSGYLIRGNSIMDIADQLDIDPDALVATVERFDKDAETGIDSEFHKGETEYECAAGDPDISPNPCLAPLGQGPYFAVRILPGDIGTLVGVKVDRDSRALDSNGRAIDGLYAIGTAASSIMGGTYPGAGTMLGPAITFGYLAARHAAGLEDSAVEPEEATRVSN